MGWNSCSRRSLGCAATGRKSRFPFLFLFPLLLLSLAGCGEEEGSPPVLTEFRPPVYRLVRGFTNLIDRPGEAALGGVVDFEDPDGDLVLLRVTWRNCGGEPENRLEIVLDPLERTKRGTIPFIITISTICPIGEYTVHFSAVDGRGLTSNALLTYEIYEPLNGG